MTAARRWDVNHETEIAESTASTVGYNTTGSAIFSRDPVAGHQTTIGYADSFSANGIDTTTLGFATLAYPTVVTINDPNPISSTVRYNYDLGVVTRQEGPPPLGHQQGAIQTTEYDAAVRVKRLTNAVNLAYTRFVYPSSQTIVNKFTTIQEGQGEAYSATIFDGAGRVRAGAGDFPGSTGHYSGQFTLYDSHGRTVQSTNPTEMTHAWAAAGDDVVGWHSSSQTYDWQGRPLITTNQDGTTKVASYGGCGCAGGEVVTLTDEGTAVGTGAGAVTKKRQQRIYSDALGRTVKSETLNWDGSGTFGTGGSVYSTTVNTYNARDQVTRVQQYQGADTSNVSQDTTMTYDGYGRLETRHVPEQNEGTATVWDYNADDTIHSTTDARGASATYGYNNRKLMTAITYGAPSGITPTPNVTYGYDEAGNRTSMTDGLGAATYHYDALSRMDWEERTMDGLGPYRLTYGYNVSGQLASLTDASGVLVSFSRDDIGRLNGITGANFTSSDQYIEGRQYRAWGALKQFSFGSQSSTTARTSASLSYDARLRTTRYELTSTMVNTVVTAAEFERNDDGTLRYARQLSSTFHDRRYSYDHTRRITQALTGAEARFETNSDQNYVRFARTIPTTRLTI